MKTKAVRLYGANDLRLEEMELPDMKDDELLVKVVSDSICMSTYKAASLGAAHKRVPGNIAEQPVIVGHEFAGDIIKVGGKWTHRYKEGSKFALQPALNYQGSLDCPGYSYRYFGGDATYNIIPNEVMELGCLMNYDGQAYFEASLAEPMSCIIGSFHGSYHTRLGVYEHKMGIVAGGKTAILAGTGPMGLGAIDYALHCERRPSLLVVSDIDEQRLARAAKIFPPAEAKACGVELIFVNTKALADPVQHLRSLTGDAGFDDVFVFAPIAAVIEQGDGILGHDGCLNFFAGPTDANLSARVNFYNVHYNAAHMMGMTGGNIDDLKEALRLTAAGTIRPAVMVTHIGGLNSVIDATLNLPALPGGKKLIYTHVDMELTAIDDFAEKGKFDQRFACLAEIINAHHGLWCAEAEAYLLSHW